MRRIGASRGFTLLELLISIIILSVMMLFLYQTVSTLRVSNAFYADRLDEVSYRQDVAETIYFDLLLAVPDSLYAMADDPNTDIVMFQSSHSIHRRIMPYIAYFVIEGELYRVESRRKILTYPLAIDFDGDVDHLGNVKTMRLYSKSKVDRLLHMVDESGSETFMKITHLQRKQ